MVRDNLIILSLLLLCKIIGFFSYSIRKYSKFLSNFPFYWECMCKASLKGLSPENLKFLHSEMINKRSRQYLKKSYSQSAYRHKQEHYDWNYLRIIIIVDTLERANDSWNSLRSGHWINFARIKCLNFLVKKKKKNH